RALLTYTKHFLYLTPSEEDAGVQASEDRCHRERRAPGGWSRSLHRDLEPAALSSAGGLPVQRRGCVVDGPRCRGGSQPLWGAPFRDRAGAAEADSHAVVLHDPTLAAPALRGIRARLRLPLALPPGRRAAHRPGRFVAVERAGRPFGRHG